MMRSCMEPCGGVDLLVGADNAQTTGVDMAKVCFLASNNFCVLG